MQKRRIERVLLDAPSNLGLRPLRPGHIPGTAHAPRALRAHGILERLGAIDGGAVPAPVYDPNEPPSYGFRNGEKLRAYSRQLAARLGELIDPQRFVVVLGGDCSILLGSALALKRRGRYGLLFIDGHTDYPFPRHPQRYEKVGFTAAGLDLGLATGHGSPELSDIDGLAPYFREEDVVVLAYRDAGTPDHYILDAWERSPMTRLPLERVREIGVAASIQEALLHLERPELDEFWIHLDVDVLDPQWMPAVDSPDPGGLRFDELEPIVRAAVQSPRAVGMELTIFDPDKDPDGRLARQLVDLLARAFAPAPDGTSGHVPRRD